MNSATNVRALADSLISGGDTRLLLGDDGLSKYGCTPYPRNTVPFGSCTASTISLRAWDAARDAATRLERLLQEASPADVADRVCAEIRDEIAAHLGLDQIPAAQVVLTPSGTDAELVALFLATVGTDANVLNLIVGPNEVGSGTTLAAAGLHFDRVVPSGIEREVGRPVDARLASRTEVEVIRLRTSTGVMRSPEEIDAEVREQVERGAQAGRRVIVHVVAHSKTGVHAPTLSTVRHLQERYGDQIVGLIDAAQGRVSRRGLRKYLQRGYMILLTGSKFYGGPPFSGALLVPPRFAGDDVRAARVPNGFGDYFTTAEMPAVWHAARERLPNRANWGLMLRWLAALAEMRAYYATDSKARLAILRRFEASVPRILGSTDCLGLLPVYEPLWSNQAERVLESKTTVFSMRVRIPGEDAPLGKTALKQWVRLLNTDLSDHLASLADSDAARQPFQIGQPVTVGQGDDTAVIRVALGASLISSLAEDPTYGATLDERLDWLDHHLTLLSDKMALMAARWNELTTSDTA